jgi:hypothetical protein
LALHFCDLGQASIIQRLINFQKASAQSLPVVMTLRVQLSLENLRIIFLTIFGHFTTSMTIEYGEERLLFGEIEI